MKKDKIKFLILILFIILSAAISIHFDLHKNISIKRIKSFILKMGYFGPIVYMLLYGFTSIILFPASLLSTSSGAIWGIYVGTFYTVIGATFSSAIPFFIARYLGRGFAEKMMKKTKLDICDKFISKNGFLSVLIMRLIPLFPWDAVNYGSGLCGIKFYEYIFATAIGTIPASFTYNVIGATLTKPGLKKIIFTIILVLCFAGLTLFLKKKLKTNN